MATRREKELTIPEKFFDFFSLGFLFGTALKSKGYRIAQALADALVLSEYGEKKASALSKAYEKKSLLEIKQILLDDLYHSECYFDIGKSDTEILLKELSRDFESRKIFYPWVYGALLYRKANKLYPEIAEELTPKEVNTLLAGTPFGVFQFRQYLTGPYGILCSAQNRSIFPQRKVHLWHCNDPECTNEHKARFTSGPSGLSDLAITLGALNSTEKQSHLDALYATRREDAGYYDAANPASLHLLLGNAFGITEMRKIVERLLESPSSLRPIIASTPIANQFNGSSAKITEKLGVDQCLQLMLLCKDADIVAAAEALILSKAIFIPPSETRTSKQKSGWYHVSSEASCHGIRFLTLGDGMPSARLKALVRQLSDEKLIDLNWSLKFEKGSDTAQKLENYSEKESPGTIIRQQIFANEKSLERSFSVLKGSFDIPQSPAFETAMIDRVMWKLGFEVPQFPFNYRALDESTSELLKVSQTCAERWDDCETTIRSAGVNYFVHLEGFLNDALSFTSWMLLSDHYRETKFGFNKKDGSRVLAQELNSDANEIVYDEAGKNTLGPLIAGFRSLVARCKEICLEPDQFVRPKAELPTYAGQSSVISFPFNHTKLILDVSEASREALYKMLLAISFTLENAEVANLRNRLEHSRNRFPTKDELFAVVEAVSKTQNDMLKYGLSASTYRSVGKAQDKWGRSRTEYIDYRGEKLSIPFRVTSLLSAIPRDPKYAIFSPNLQLQNSAEVLRFVPKEDSEYAKIWDGYPIRTK